MNASPQNHNGPQKPEGERQPLPVASPAPGDSCGAPRGPARQSGPREQAEPFSEDELRRALRRPYLIIEYVLGAKERLARSLSQGRSLWLLAFMLLVTSLLSTVPYGVLSPVKSFWKVAVLYTGSLFICFPCLHMFAQFLGFRFDLAQNSALALVITAVAGLFTFGFFPIIWFIDYTTRPGAGTLILPEQLSVFLLALSLLMGIVQMGRCLALEGMPAGEAGQFGLLVALWLPLLVFITYRMADLLALL